MSIKEIKLTKENNDFIAYCYDKNGKQVNTISDNSIKEPSTFAYFVIDHLYIQEDIDKKRIKMYWSTKTNLNKLDYTHVKCPECSGIMETEDVKEFPDETDFFNCSNCDYCDTRQEIERHDLNE